MVTKIGLMCILHLNFQLDNKVVFVNKDAIDSFGIITRNKSHVIVLRNDNRYFVKQSSAEIINMLRKCQKGEG